MARRLIGLDIGTNAVTVAEIEAGDVPTLRAFGQVALPPDAMREGEVVDEAAVTEAIQRLWREVGLRKGAVRVGLASPRVIVRPVELPTMSEDDLAGALRFQAQELIPIPVDEAVLDFQVLETVPGQEPGASTSRVLLAAAHRETVDRLVRAVRGAGLDVDAVDLVPLALVRSLGRRVTGDGEGAEAFVSIGAGVTVVVVHEAGLPRFVRILGVGGRSLTEAVARDLDVAFDTAEALKRQTAGDGLAEQARLAMERPLSVLLEEVRGSLDFYRSQADSLPLLRVLLTGGTARLPGLEERLRRLVDVPVEQADPRSTLVIGDIGFTGDEFEQLDPFLPVAVGLALGGLAAGRRINLLGAAARRRADRRGVLAAAVAVAALVALLGWLSVARLQSISDEEDRLEAQTRVNADLQVQIDQLADARRAQEELEATQRQVEAALATDVSWSRMLNEIARTIPNDTWLTAFQGSVTQAAVPGTPAPQPTPGPEGRPAVTTSSAAGAPTAPATIAGPTGTLSFTAKGLDFPSIAAWITRISEIPSLADLWVPSSTKAELGSREIVDFTSTATITPTARSNRAERLQEQQP